MRIFSSNEWDPLKTVVVGDATFANWPRNCPDFRRLESKTTWTETPVPSGPVDQWVIDEANADLDNFANFLTSCGVEVYRPTQINFQETDGMYNYCPRDRLLVVDDTVIDAPMAYGCRDSELAAYEFLDCEFIRAGGRFDAANVCRLNDDLLYLVSSTGDVAGAEWLADYFHGTRTVHRIENVYSGVHIDSTIVPVREGLVVLNAGRMNEDNVPAPLKNWDKIWMHAEEMAHQNFYNYPYASNFIGLNFFTVDPTSIVCDPKQETLRRKLDAHGVSSQGIDLRHSRTLGGGHQCTTLDLHRE